MHWENSGLFKKFNPPKLVLAERQDKIKSFRLEIKFTKFNCNTTLNSIKEQQVALAYQ
jgi:hypothetical protein